MPLYTTAPVHYLNPAEAGAGDVRFGRGPAYWQEEKDTWWAEADFTEDKFTTDNPDSVREGLVFYEFTEVENSQQWTKPGSVLDREKAVWESRGKGLNAGELICLRRVEYTPTDVLLGLRKSTYPEHHSSYIFRDKPDLYPGVGPDEYTNRFLPSTGYLHHGGISSRTHLHHFPSFALSFLMEADGEFVIPLRGKAVDQYAGVPSLFSGGRIDGAPHKMVDRLCCLPSSKSTIFYHAKGLLQREMGGETDELNRKLISFLQLTGLQRAADLDTTLSGWGTLDCTVQEIETLMHEHCMLAPEGAKYTGLMAVPATADGIVRLLGMPFPPTVLPVIVYAAPAFGVNPQDVLPGLRVFK